MSTTNFPSSPASNPAVPANSGYSKAKNESLQRRVESLRLPSEVTHQGQGSWLGWVLSLIFVGTAVWLVMNLVNQPTSQPETASAAAPAEQPASAPSNPTASQPAAAPVGKFALESTGYIVPAHQILVSPQVGGRMMKLNVVEGMRVEKGEVLAEIEKTEYDAEVKRVEAMLESSRQRLLELERGNRPEEIAQAEAELAESSAQLPQLKSEYERNKELIERDAVPRLDFEKAESAYHSMQRRIERLDYALQLLKEGPRKERIAVARAEVGQLEAELIKAQWKLDNCTVRAPISGTILKKNAEEGNIVNPIAFNGSYSICDMADLSDLEVDLNIQERDISKVYVGQECEVRSEAYPDRVYRGVVSRLMPIADRAKGAIPVRVKLSVPADEEGVYLKPEMSAVASFLAPQSP